MRLYHYPVSSNARRVLMTAEHLAIRLDLVEIDLMDPGARKRLEELNPNTKVPVLDDGGFLLWESCAIMQYLADKTPGHTLYPQQLQARADVNRWMFWACQHFSPMIATFTWENLWKGMLGEGGPDPLALACAETGMRQFGGVLDAHLAQRGWMVGEGLSLADFAIAAPLMYIERARIPVSGFAHLLRWFDQVRQLDAWTRTHADPARRPS